MFLINAQVTVVIRTLRLHLRWFDNDAITFQNTNVTSMYVGPRNLMLADNQKLIAGPLPFVVIPPGHYCVVQNPIDHT